MERIETSPEKLTRIARKTLAILREWNAPLTPENYHLFFEYVKGQNQELSTDMDLEANSGGAFNAATTARLYDKHIRGQSGMYESSQFQKELAAIIKNVLLDTTSAEETSAMHRTNLEEHSRGLSQATESDEIQSLVQAVIEETTGIGQAGLRLEEALSESQAEMERLRQKLEEVQEKALHDPLTKLHNRRAMESRAEDLCEGFRSAATPFSVIMLDLDHFKRINDTHGHQIGDAVLRMMGSLLTECVKGRDFAARYGGEEFVVLLPATRLENACKVAEHIRIAVSDRKLFITKTKQELEPVTVSLGIAEIRHADTFESVMERADKALYAAKQAGRNCCKSERDVSQTQSS